MSQLCIRGQHERVQVEMGSVSPEVGGCTESEEGGGEVGVLMECSAYGHRRGSGGGMCQPQPKRIRAGGRMLRLNELHLFPSQRERWGELAALPAVDVCV